MHYKLIVIGDNPEEQLEPFDENIEVVTSREATAEEIGGIIIHAYEDGDCNVDYQSSLRDIFKAVGGDWDGCTYSMLADTVIVTTDRNPNGKWDWYVIGGRYKDSITNKDGEKVDSAVKKEIKAIDKRCFAILVNGQWFDRETHGKNFDEIKDALYSLAHESELITIIDCHT